MGKAFQQHCWLSLLPSPELGIKSCRSRKNTGKAISKTSISKGHGKAMGWERWVGNRHCSRAVTPVGMSGCPRNDPHNVACLSAVGGKKTQQSGNLGFTLPSVWLFLDRSEVCIAFTGTPTVPVLIFRELKSSVV